MKRILFLNMEEEEFVKTEIKRLKKSKAKETETCSCGGLMIIVESSPYTNKNDKWCFGIYRCSGWLWG